jgi:3-carboxy-cis,cis-muconate cycloisomerase
MTGRFDLLFELHGDREMAAVFGRRRTVASWLAVEAALAQAQAELGIITMEVAEAITRVCAEPDMVDEDRLWEAARTVGYPILGLVRQIDAALPEPHRGQVHLGATSQDIMDSGLALQLRRACDLAIARIGALGAELSALVEAHRRTVLPGRTHAQQAVPTTFGAKAAVYLAELTRHRGRVVEAARLACAVSLFGAGGTAAALGPQATMLRGLVAARLGLADAAVPWHVARDGVTHAAQVVAGTAALGARLAREVVDLSRTEIAEVTEARGHHRGASSTMPQKANPILSEAIIGFAVSATSAAGGLYRAMEAGHERAAGEWQAEWSLLPFVFIQAGSALHLCAELAAGLVVHPDRMRTNLAADGGLIMAEAVMIRLAPRLGREVAHDVVYQLASDARRDGRSLGEVMVAWQRQHPELDGLDLMPEPEDYLGEADVVCDAAVAGWRAAVATGSAPDREA